MPGKDALSRPLADSMTVKIQYVQNSTVQEHSHKILKSIETIKRLHSLLTIKITVR